MDNKNLKQKAKTWWDENPFNYNVVESEGSWEYFRNIDRKIIKWMPYAQSKYPLLSNFIDYKILKNKRVLDIGCGAGWSSEQFVRMGSEVTAIDITPKAVELTKKRFKLYGLKADILIADVEHLPFPDNYFDYVLAWGVVMHTPNTDKAVDEIWRVLKPGGKAGAMMYHKNSLKWWYFIWFAKGVLRLKLLKYSHQELSDRYTDGAYTGGNMHTKFYTKSGLYNLWHKFRTVRVGIHDNLGTIDQLPYRKFPLAKYFLPTFIKKFLVLKFGGYAWIDAKK
jgi:ubiquinone/menaquinone biosynthesis C-methylase UbiE